MGRLFGEWEDEQEPNIVAKQKPSKAAVNRANELMAAQHKAQWVAWATCVHRKRAKKDFVCRFDNVFS